MAVEDVEHLQTEQQPEPLLNGERFNQSGVLVPGPQHAHLREAVGAVAERLRGGVAEGGRIEETVSRIDCVPGIEGIGIEHALEPTRRCGEVGVN